MVRGRKQLNRRRFLRLTAISAIGATLAACTGSSPVTPASPVPTAVAVAPTSVLTATTTASRFKESPKLAEMVAVGILPPVQERLPNNPYTPPHTWLTIGNYGGVLTKAYSTGNDPGLTLLFILEMQYGTSPLRWLKDGLAIGPGLMESWAVNADASEWTFKLREGVKWSDGHPLTTADIQYWWEYMIGGNGKAAEFPSDLEPLFAPPDETLSGTSTPATLRFVDDYTLVMVFDAPAPLTADRMANWVNDWIPAGGAAAWFVPRHYMEQFNPVLHNDIYKNWDEHFARYANITYLKRPCLTGWKLNSFQDGVQSVWSRNPYYWVVDAEGNQLPYIDEIVVTILQDREIEHLIYTEGRVDHAHFHNQTLADIQGLRAAQPRSKLEVRLWDGGAGAFSGYFFNYDYKDEQVRGAIRDPIFRQALSLAFDRAEIQKSLWFGLGELTTGTLSPKAIEYNINNQGRAIYAAWRDSFVAYDPDAARAMLDAAGYTVGAGGKRTLPDGSPLRLHLTITTGAASDIEGTKTERLAKNWQDIGIDARITPVLDEGFFEKWTFGEYMMNLTQNVGDGPNHLAYPGWLVPTSDPSGWAPLHARGHKARGTAVEKDEQDIDPWERTTPWIGPGDKAFSTVIGDLWSLYDQAITEPDAMKRHQLVWDMIKIHIQQGPFFCGAIANQPRIILVKEGLKNVPTRDDLLKEGLGGFVDPWIIPSPAVYDPETWYWDDPAQHGG